MPEDPLAPIDRRLARDFRTKAKVVIMIVLFFVEIAILLWDGSVGAWPAIVVGLTSLGFIAYMILRYWREEVDPLPLPPGPQGVR